MKSSAASGLAEPPSIAIAAAITPTSATLHARKKTSR